MTDTDEIELRTANRVSSNPASPHQDTSSASLVDAQGIATDRRRRSSIASEQVQGPNLQTQGIDFFTWVSSQWNKDQELDELERHLQSRVATEPTSQRLLNAYTRLKDRPSGKLFNALLVFRTCSSDDVSAPDYQSLVVEEGTIFTSCLSILKDNLSKEDSVSLRVCVLGNDVSEYIRSNGYSFASNIFVSKEILESRRNAPVLAILQAIQQEWQLSEEVINDCNAASRLPKPVLIGLPSESSVQPFTLNSSSWQIISLQWLRDITSFSQDLSVYVWQPHLEPLTTLSASIYIGPEASDSRPRNALMLLKCSKSIDQTLLSTTRWLRDRAPSSTQALSSIETEIISIILSIYSILILDTCFLIGSLFSEIDKLSIEGRRNPSVSKIHYTLYLGDCQKASAQALEDAIGLLASISTYINSQERIATSFDTWNETIRKDLEYLQTRLQDANTKVIELRSLIKDQLDLRQFRIGRILAILAAIYLPFSFVSGFFGMNISDPLWNMPENDSTSSPNSAASMKATKLLGNILSNSNISKQVNQTIPGPNNSSIELPFFENEFDAIITAITTSGPHLFAFKTFLIVAFIITFSTIVLPLLAGAIFRTALRSIDRYKGYWRVLILFLGIGAIISTRIFLWGFIYVIIFGVPQGLLCTWKFYTAKKPFQEKRWIAYAGLLSMSVALDISAGYFPGLTGILPLIYLFILGFVSDIRVFLRGHLPHLIQMLRTRKIATAHYKYWIWALVLTWIGMNFGLYFADTVSYCVVIGYLVSIGLYGMEKFFTALRTRENVAQWFLFEFLVLPGALIIDYFFSAPISMATIPFAYLILVRYWVNDQEFMKSYFPSWLVRQERAVLPVSDTRDTSQ